MMNPGDFKSRITLLERSEPERDEMGGLKPSTYTPVFKVWAKQRDKTSTFRQVIGDYVTMDTCYFVIRDISSKYPVNTDWRISFEGYTYVINSVVKLGERAPYYLELEATRLGGINK